MHKKRGSKRSSKSSNSRNLAKRKYFLLSALLIIVIGTILIFAYKPLKETYGKAVEAAAIEELPETEVLVPGDITNCGIINTPGEYVLVNNITLSENKAGAIIQQVIQQEDKLLGKHRVIETSPFSENNICFKILTDGVTIDGGGFTVQTVPPLDYMTAIQIGSITGRITPVDNGGIVIKNFGIIENFSSSIMVYNYENLTISNNTIMSPSYSYGIYTVVQTDGETILNNNKIILDSNIIMTGYYGVYIYSPQNNEMILDNNVIMTVHNGVYIESSSNNLEITNNKIYSSSPVYVAPDSFSYPDSVSGFYVSIDNYTKNFLAEGNNISSNNLLATGMDISAESSVIRNNSITMNGEASNGIVVTDPASQEFNKHNDISMNKIQMNGNGIPNLFQFYSPDSPDLISVEEFSIYEVYGSAGIALYGAGGPSSNSLYHNTPESESWNVEKNVIILKGKGLRGIINANTLGATLKENSVLSENASSVLIAARLAQNLTLENNNLESRGEKSAGILLASSKNVRSTNDVIKTPADGNSTILLVDTGHPTAKVISTLSYTNTSVDENTISVSDEEVFAPPTGGDSWTFLPEYQPGDGVYEGEIEPMPPTGGAIVNVLGTTDYGFPVDPLMQKSILSMNWLAEFYVKNNTANFSEAPLKVISQSGEEALTTTTGSDGKTSIIKLNEYYYNGSQKVYSTPHNLEILSGEDLKSAVFNLSEWKSGIYVINLAKEPVSITRFSELTEVLRVIQERGKTFRINLEKSLASRVETSAGALIEIVPKETAGNVQVTVAVSENNTKIVAPAQAESLNKTIDITVSDAVNNNIDTARIVINYTDEEITASNINESTIRIWKWDDTAGSWMSLQNSGVDTNSNFVWANVTSFSTYGVFGNKNAEAPPVAVTPPSGGGDTGGGGSSGGGGSGGGGGGSYGGSVVKKPAVAKNDTITANITDGNATRIKTSENLTPTEKTFEKVEEKNATQQPVQEAPAQTPEEKSGIQTRIILISALAGIVLLFAAWKFYLSPEAKLRRSIKKNIKAGYSKKDIIKMYVQKGWSEETVRKASNA